ncbi:hypothetical protein Q31a_14000 [Aureliella helgolandensis]|uniref:Uncharacterized protein n=1 Tax=Aureliella helgolandensis TaxID=2527968 RepID=A0A518G3E8_9BACT|nr:hypothetical protein Q31a_14000 [Aureliella helgolandensis]
MIGAMSTEAPVPFRLLGVVFFGIAVEGIRIVLHNKSAKPEDRIGGREISEIVDRLHCKNGGRSISTDSRFCRY